MDPREAHPHDDTRGGRRTHRSQHVGPFLLLGAKRAFYLRVGSASQTLHMTIVLVASCGATWAPEVHTHARLRVPVKAVFKEYYQFEVLNEIYL